MDKSYTAPCPSTSSKTAGGITAATATNVKEKTTTSGSGQVPAGGIKAEDSLSSQPVSSADGPRPPKKAKATNDRDSSDASSSRAAVPGAKLERDSAASKQSNRQLASASITARLMEGKGVLGLLHPEVVEEPRQREDPGGGDEEAEDEDLEAEEEDDEVEDDDLEEEEEDEDVEDDEEEEEGAGCRTALADADDEEDVDVDEVVTRLVCPALDEEREARRTEDRKLLALLAHFDEEQLNRFETFRRATFAKAGIRRLVQSVSNCSISQNVVIAIAGMTKVYVGEIVEEALDYKERLGESGPLQPKHIREGFRLLSQQRDSCLSVVENPLR